MPRRDGVGTDGRAFIAAFFHNAPPHPSSKSTRFQALSATDGQQQQITIERTKRKKSTGMVNARSRRSYELAGEGEAMEKKNTF